jgi:hypothetical protein
MKYLGVFILMGISTTLFAKSWRVNNNPDVQADFRTLADAHITAGEGDTIYLEPSLKCYEGFTCTKPLVLIGAGYFLSENSPTQSNALNSVMCGDITFDPGSEGAKMMGISMWDNTVNIKTSYLMICKNLIKDIALVYQKGTFLNNLFITQNYIHRVYGTQYSSWENYFIDGFVFSNNIVVSECRFSYNRYKLDCPCYSMALYGDFFNNVFLGDVSFESSTFRNNIFYKSDLSTNFLKINAYNTVEENIFARVLPRPDVNNYKIPLSNVDNANMSTLFVGGGSPDGKWRLQSGSTIPIKDKCGVFNGLTSYVLSGIPNVPTIYYLDVPPMVNQRDGINVTVKAKTNN